MFHLSKQPAAIVRTFQITADSKSTLIINHDSSRCLCINHSICNFEIITTDNNKVPTEEFGSLNITFYPKRSLLDYIILEESSQISTNLLICVKKNKTIPHEICFDKSCEKIFIRPSTSLKSGKIVYMFKSPCASFLAVNLEC